MARGSIQHIGTPKALATLRSFGHSVVLASTTEKTDGSYIHLSADRDGFFIQTWNSPPIDIFKSSFAQWSKDKFGDQAIPELMAPFDRFREAVAKSFSLLDALEAVSHITGEMISAHAPKLDYYHVCPIGTAYSREHLGSEGLFVIHRHDNPWLTNVPYDARSLSSDHVKVDDDWSPPIEINLRSVDTPTDLYDVVGEQFANRSGKWGPEVEGYVIHANGQRFKWIHPTWKQRKTERWQKL